MKIDAKAKHYRKLNEEIRTAIRSGEKNIVLDNVNGHRYIGDNIGGEGTDKISIKINGTPGNDLAFCMNGPQIVVDGNGQDGIANTMSAGKIVINGNAGDICGYAMRGGKLYIKGNIGYRAGIHMKEYKDHFPIIVVGGKAGDFLGEYMAGGILILLGMTENKDEQIANIVGNGMHGGRIFIRGKIPEWKLGKEVKIAPLDDEDKKQLKDILEDYFKSVNFVKKPKVDLSEFIKLYPGSKRPYGQLYAY